MRPRIHPADPVAAHVVKTFGGVTQVARMCGIKPSSVSGWMLTGIPQARAQYLRLLNPSAFNTQRSH